MARNVNSNEEPELAREQCENLLAKMRSIAAEGLGLKETMARFQTLLPFPLPDVDEEFEEPEETAEMRANRAIGEKLVQELEHTIHTGLSLPEIVDAFEAMCRRPAPEDDILFETGIFDFTGENLFYFCLTRQFSNGGDEFFQVHVNVLYKPEKANRKFKECLWSMEEKNIFDYIRNSSAYAWAKGAEYVELDIRMDET